MNLTIGIIAEDESDVNSARILIHRISKNNRIKIKQFLGKGCGKLKRKCNSWAKQLYLRGCTVLILIHDLDYNKLSELEFEVRESLNPCPIKKHLICIPVQEMEAWFLSDPNALQKALKLIYLPKVSGTPEKINSPKEVLEKVILKASGNEKLYLNTKHNEIISKHISLAVLKSKCPSYVPFHDFITQHIR